jgi:hypothetical protein
MRSLNIRRLLRTFLRHTTPDQLTIGSLWERKDRRLAALALTRGEVIGVFNRGVNALWLDAESAGAVEKMHAMKGEQRARRPVALTLGFEEFAPMIDRARLPNKVRRLLEDPDELRGMLGSLCFVRAPVHKEHQDKLPSAAISFDEGGQPWLQSWDPWGHRPTSQLIREARLQGVRFPAVTSMNVSGEPEIVDQELGQMFSHDRGVALYLRDPHANPRLTGSYTIITLSERGIELTRDGNVPGVALKMILGSLLQLDGARRANHPQILFPSDLADGLSASGARMAILLFLAEYNPQRINDTLKRFETFAAH